MVKQEPLCWGGGGVKKKKETTKKPQLLRDFKTEDSKNPQEVE